MTTAPDPLAPFPKLAALEPEARAALVAAAQPISAPAGAVLFRPGDACERFVMLRAGTVRVQLLSDTGHEIVLYRVRPGETCVITTSCLIAHDAYSAEGIADGPVDALVVPMAVFESLLATSPVFRGFVMGAFGTRLAELMHRIDDVAFRPIDARLAARLLASAGDEVATTHQALAIELGTAREVISRRLKLFERDGLVALGRGTVELRDREGLRRVAAAGGVPPPA
ncbi:MAG: Crp/Fnr family transcriptional regulator [Alphaproteobacteria bacterium]|nr:Crp/Fnr family transcriptional regulator [Alphaproteobacteria bacterium]